MKASAAGIENMTDTRNTKKIVRIEMPLFCINLPLERKLMQAGKNPRLHLKRNRTGLSC